MRTVENQGLCPKCEGNTNTLRHPFAKIWCATCGFVSFSLVRVMKPLGAENESLY